MTLSAAFMPAVLPSAARDWTPAGDKITTRRGKEASPDNVWQQYPRPQLKRADRSNLNGLRDYAIITKEVARAPSEHDGQIMVPFAVESALPGVGQHFSENDKLAGNHKVGFDTFEFNITKFLKGGGNQKLVVAVTDPTDKEGQARGKQRFDQGGIWYTPVSGTGRPCGSNPCRKHIRDRICA